MKFPMRWLGINILFCLSLCHVHANSNEREHTKAELLKDITQAWNVPSEPVATPTEASNLIEDKTIRLDKLQHMVLPKINFNELPLSQALKILTELTELYDADGKGFNFVLIDPQHLNPIIDLNVKNLPLDKIIHFLAQSSGFSVQVENDAVIFQGSTSLQIETRYFPISRGTALQILQYSDADSAKDKSADETKLRQFFEKIGILFKEPGTGFAYDGSRLIVSNTANNLDKIQNVLKFYQATYQVAIEAKFLEVQQGSLEELGVKCNLGTNNNIHAQSNSNLRLMQDLRTDVRSTSTTDKTFTQASAPVFPNMLNLGTNLDALLNATTVLNGYQMGFIMQALEQQTDADLMSAPKVTVLSGRTAEIVVAQELRYPESYRDTHAEVGSRVANDGGSAGTALMAGAPEHFVTRNVGVEMSVTPIVETNHRINLSLQPCVTEFEGFIEYGGNNVVTYGNSRHVLNAGYYQPIFSKRQIKTELTIQNGSTVVMGGLSREEIKEVKDKIPLLSDIPLLGQLFRSKGQSSQKRNLLIFVTANLLDADGHPLPNVEMIKSGS